MSDAQLTTTDVRAAAFDGRVRPHPDYHAHHHHVRWNDCLYALANRSSVAADTRAKHAGTMSYVAFGRVSRSRTLRVDFQLDASEGNVILVVTAIPY